MGIQLKGKWVFSLPTSLVAELFWVVNQDFWEPLRRLCSGARGKMANVTLLTVSSLLAHLISWADGSQENSVIYPPPNRLPCLRSDPHILPTFLLCTEKCPAATGPWPSPGHCFCFSFIYARILLYLLSLQHWQFTLSAEPFSSHYHLLYYLPP